MPDIELIPVPLYQSNQPYNYQIDNIPILALIERILLVNSQVDIDAQVLSDAQGTQGTVANRLAQSVEADGSLKSSAIDAALHNIAEHADGYVLVDGEPISYVRMLLDERAKLSGIDSDANEIEVRFLLNAAAPSGLPSQISVVGISEIEFVDGEVRFIPSDSVYWTVDADGAIAANTTFPAAVRHLHYYDLIPAPQDVITPDHKNYLVTSAATPYKEDSLRVYVNGIRLTKYSNVTAGGAPRGNYVPTGFPSAPTWFTLTYTEDTAADGVVESGEFSLSSAIDADDVITVDFDTHTS